MNEPVVCPESMTSQSIISGYLLVGSVTKFLIFLRLLLNMFASSNVDLHLLNRLYYYERA